MNAWNARSATSANKKLFLKAGAAALLFAMPHTAYAQASAPGMFGVKEIVVDYAEFANPKTADSCSLSREQIAAIINRTLVESNVPAIAVAEAKPPMMGVARINLVPEISTFDNGGLDCTSWVSLTAETRSNVRIPPVDMPRSIKAVYWHEGTLVASEHSAHERLVEDLLKKMAEEFAKQYRIDQPPELPPSGQ